MPERHLAALARDAFAACQSPRPSGVPAFVAPPVLAQAIADHPARPAFEDAVLADDGLARLFADGRFATNLGVAGTIHVSRFAEALVSAAYRALALDGHVDADALAARAVEHLAATRTLLAPRAVEIATRVGVAGIELPRNAAVDLPWGRLRALTAPEHELASDLAATFARAVFATPARVRLYAGDDVQRAAGAEIEEARRLDGAFARLALTLFLAVEGPQPAGAVQGFTIFDAPFEAGFTLSWSPTLHVRPTRLDADALAAVPAWAERVQRHHHRSIDVAASRAIRALTERGDPADALVDAMIALENLFGSGQAQGEVTFRVATATACLLETEASARRGLRRAVLDLYGERSRIVHGNPPSDEVAKLRDDAVRIVRDALRALFRDRPELLANRERGLDLILGA